MFNLGDLLFCLSSGYQSNYDVLLDIEVIDLHSQLTLAECTLSELNKVLLLVDSWCVESFKFEREFKLIVYVNQK